MSFKKMLPLLILIAFVILANSFLPQILGSVEAGSDTANMTTAMQNQTNSTRDVSITTMSVTRYIPLLLGVCVLIGAVMFISKRKY